VALAVCAPPAHASVYDVWGCRLPTGESTSAEGWTSSSSGGAYVANWRINSPPGANRFQAVVRRQQGYPYVTGSSAPVAVHIVR
jgi:hypothetical protein